VGSGGLSCTGGVGKYPQSLNNAGEREGMRDFLLVTSAHRVAFFLRPIFSCIMLPSQGRLCTVVAAKRRGRMRALASAVVYRSTLWLALRCRCDSQRGRGAAPQPHPTPTEHNRARHSPRLRHRLIAHHIDTRLSSLLLANSLCWLVFPVAESRSFDAIL